MIFRMQKHYFQFFCASRPAQWFDKKKNTLYTVITVRFLKQPLTSDL